MFLPLWFIWVGTQIPWLYGPFSSVMMITNWSTGTSAWIIRRKELQKYCFKWYVKIDFGLWPCQNIWFNRGCMGHCSSLWHEKSIQRLILLFDYLVILSRTETKTCHQRTSFDKRWPRPSRISGKICNGRLISFYDVISQAFALHIFIGDEDDAGKKLNF